MPVLLTSRQREVLGWAVQGKTTWETAVVIGISPHTVTFHQREAAKRLGVYTLLQAVAHAARNGELEDWF